MLVYKYIITYIAGEKVGELITKQNYNLDEEKSKIILQCLFIIDYDKYKEYLRWVELDGLVKDCIELVEKGKIAGEEFKQRILSYSFDKQSLDKFKKYEYQSTLYYLKYGVVDLFAPKYNITKEKIAFCL